MAFHANSSSHKVYNGFNGFNPKSPFLIGVAGGTASGKSTVCQKIMDKVGQYSVDHQQRQVICISQDSFYKELTAEEKKKAAKGKYNFDHPDAFDTELMLRVLKEILEGNDVQIPIYDFKSNCRKEDEYITVQPADVVLFEGILVFYFPEVRELFHMKLFVDTDPDTRLSRRVLRDTRERGRELDQILHQYTTFVKPAFEDFCLPTKKYADVIIPRGADNEDLNLPKFWMIAVYCSKARPSNSLPNNLELFGEKLFQCKAQNPVVVRNAIQSGKTQGSLREFLIKPESHFIFP